MFVGVILVKAKLYTIEVCCEGLVDVDGIVIDVIFREAKLSTKYGCCDGVVDVCGIIAVMLVEARLSTI